MSLSLSYAAGAGADHLQDQDEFRRKIAEMHLEQQMRQADLALRRQSQEEQRRQSDRRFSLDEENSKALREQRESQAARDRAAAEKDSARQRGLQGLMSDPNALAGLNPLQRLLTLNQYGVANVGIHDTESTDEHTKHTAAENAAKRDAEFGEWKRRTDYSENLQRSRPVKIASAVDDPALPLSSQRDLARIVQRHPGDFAGAQAELTAYLEHPRTLESYPKLSPVKALDALRRQYSGAGGGSEDIVDQIVRQTLGSMGGGSGRGAGPGTSSGGARPQGARAPEVDNGAGAPTLAELEAIARRRGTTVEQEKQRAAAAGFIVR